MVKTTLTPEEVYDLLVNGEEILTQEGRITFNLGSVSIIVKQRDVVGNLLQEWLQGWFDKRNIYYELNDNTQMPPDFFLARGNKRKSLLEVKAFNREASPGFDIADFNAYQKELVEKPWMLDANYLIFGYDMSEAGVVTVKDLWLKKVWEITRSMADWPLNLQIKKGVVHKIRPAAFYSKQAKVFGSKEDFLSAVEQTIWQNSETKQNYSLWRVKFLANYKSHYGRDLIIPKWEDIGSKYLIKKKQKMKK